ncbi:MAG TPA: helix-turn-helix transcriptional regulator [Patescibacteria group bacterium]|nr:helix-turn-helix transcriptional regulator [Patescibacteria group bacterium]
MNEKRNTWIQTGDTIRLLRLQHKLTVAQLAERSGVSIEAIDHYENNVWRPGEEIMARLATVFGITAAEFANGVSILYEEDQDVLLVSHLGSNRIRVIGRIKMPNPIDGGWEGNKHV